MWHFVATAVRVAEAAVVEVGFVVTTVGCCFRLASWDHCGIMDFSSSVDA